MKIKLIPCLSFVLSACFVPLSAQAFWTSTSVDRANIATTAPFLRIVPARYYEPTNHPMVEFSIFALPKDNGGADLLSGVLTIKDSQESKTLLITTVVQAEEPPQGAIPGAVPKSWAGKYKVFRFYIAASLLTNSGFCVNYTPDLKWGTAGGSYVFTLGEFVNGTNTQPASIADAATNTNLTKQISEVLVECQQIKSGMTRAELMKVFTKEGGVSNRAHQTFVYRACPYVKVNVDFTPSDSNQKMDERQPTDIISKISKPYLNWSITD